MGERRTRRSGVELSGERNCKLEDPFGHVWMIATHEEDVSLEEIRRRAADAGRG